MTEQTPADRAPSGDRTEPTAPDRAADPSGADRAVPDRASRWRTLVRRPGPEGYLAAGLSALVVLVGLGGFLVGRASVDEQQGPTEVGQQWRRGPLPGDLPDPPFGGDRDGGYGPGIVPGAPS
ncbi:MULTISPECIES: hypothetical protein [unclassified Nocardioides]|uniref:hypothetical protein n=1 Tax=unclassified Nocardioides TaxID=2615069 RepID=UPI000056F651|nr:MULTISPECIES: hypothetical protein [unclassified Nocardioides]ABL79956.1 hypothetical protein Noca_0413 [Nocardioides sp. JS614]